MQAKLLVLFALVAPSASTHHEGVSQPDCAPYAFGDGGALGYKDAQGQVIIRPSFLGAHDCFSEGLAGVNINGKWFYIDQSGEIAIGRSFDDAKPFKDGFARVLVGDEWRRIDKKGRFPSPYSRQGLLRLLRGAPDASPTWPIVWLACSTTLAIGAHFLRRQGIRYARLMRETKTSRIANARPGPVEIKGRAHATQPVKSPHLGKPCVYYEVRVQERRASTQGNAPHWVTVDKDVHARPFLIKDRSGTAQLDPSDAKVTLAASHRSQQNWSPSGKADYVAISSILGIRMSNEQIGADRTLRIEEDIIPVGAPVYVLGSARKPMPTEAANGAQIVLEKDRVRDVFIVSTLREDQLIETSTVLKNIALVTQFLATAAGLFFLAQLLARLLA